MDSLAIPHFLWLLAAFSLGVVAGHLLMLAFLSHGQRARLLADIARIQKRLRQRYRTPARGHDDEDRSGGGQTR